MEAEKGKGNTMADRKRDPWELVAPQERLSKYAPKTPVEERPKKNWRVRRQGREGNRRGIEAEERFQFLCTTYFAADLAPFYILRIVRSTPREDSEGKDFFAETIEGLRIPIDIKASQNAARVARRKHRKNPSQQGIILLIVSPERTNPEIFEEMLVKVSARRTELLATRAAAE